MVKETDVWDSITRQYLYVLALLRFKGTAMQIEKALINDRLRVTKVS